MTKQIVIEISDSKWDAHFQAVGDIIGAATFLEANIQVEDV